MKKIIVFSIASLICACSSIYEYSYDNEHSRAYNIARAGGLSTGISDASIPKDEIGQFTDTKTFGAIYAVTGYHSTILPLSSWQGASLNLMNYAFTPKQQGARNSFVAWMPSSEALSAKQAQEKMISIGKRAIEKSLNSKGITFKVIYETKESVFYHVYNNDWNCKTWVNGQTKSDDMCEIRLDVYQPRLGTTPAFITGSENTSYIFSSSASYQYNQINITNGKNSKMPQSQLYANISNNLPEWVAIYLAPKKVEIDTGEKVPYPVILQKGKAEYFVIPKNQ